MAKPVVFIAAGGKPVTVVESGGLPVTEVTALGQPVTEATGAMPVTRVLAEGATSWAPSYVNNGGTAYISYDGASGVGSDSDTLEIVCAFRSLNTQPAAISRMVHIVGGRVNLSFTATWRISVILISTGGNLVDWTSANNAQGIFHSAGEYEFRMRASLGATPTMEVWVRTTVDGVTGDWTTVTGSFAVGPTTGTIDCSRGGQAGNEIAIMAQTTGASIMNADFGYLWWKAGSLQAADAFGSDGVRINPATVSTPDLYVTGPAANLTVDAGGGKTLVLNGPFTDV